MAVAVTGTLSAGSSDRQTKHNQEELPRVRGQGWQPGGATLHPRQGVAAGRRNPTPIARDGRQEEQPHVQGAVAVWAQEGLEEISHVEGQEGWQ